MTAQPVLDALPPTAQLSLAVSSSRLLADLGDLVPASWGTVRATGPGSDQAARLGWTTLALRSLGGQADRTDPGGAGLLEFEDTPLLARCPEVGALLDRLPVPIRSVRLMALAPSAESHRHVDPAYNFAGGTVRLHVPLVTDPSATMEVDGCVEHWGTDAVWYADFTRMHQVSNDGEDTRIHLVIDTHVSPELIALFPEPFRTADVRSNAVFDEPVVGSSDTMSSCTFTMPFALSSRADQARGPVDAEVRTEAGVTIWWIGGEPRFRLLPLGGGRFRMAGWTCAQLLELRPDRAEVVLVARSGSRSEVVRLPAQFTDPGVRSLPGPAGRARR